MINHSLAYQALDAQVLAGLADAPALTDSNGELSFAQLLHDSASIAGALHQFGVNEGTDLTIALTAGRHQVISILAAVRLGANLVGESDLRIEGDPAGLVGADPEGPITWANLQAFGRTDPAPARPHDDPVYAERLIATFSTIFTPLLQGRPINL